MKYKIVVDKQSRNNPSNEKREYEVDIEELHCRGDVYDSLVITKDEDYVMRRLQKNEYNVLNILEQPIKEPLLDINIELFEGDNYIYLLDVTGNKIYAEYLVKSDFNDLYVTRRELTGAIETSAGQIELSVNQELDNRLTGAKIIMAINGEDREIQIDADKINIEGKAVKFKTNTTVPHIYTEADAQKIISYCLGESNLTAEEMQLYDVDGIQGINLEDAQKIYEIVQNNNGKNEGTFEINPYDSRKIIIIKNYEGEETFVLGTHGMHLKFLDVDHIEASSVILKDYDNADLVNIIKNLTTRIENLEEATNAKN